ncbi:MAG: hypothetical protein DWI22_02520 [Planctomycetota bacterium]|nr:MAG: hypothetical protein DWI22_02520 [Planctomycetota bacterium]
MLFGKNTTSFGFSSTNSETLNYRNLWKDGVQPNFSAVLARASPDFPIFITSSDEFCQIEVP